MALQSHYTWNEVDASNTRDYSTNGLDSTAMVTTSFQSAEIGSAVELDGVNDGITFGDIWNFGGTNNFTICSKVRIDSSKEQALAFKEDQWEVGFDVNDKAYIKIIIGATTFELTSSASVETGGDYKTVMWKYNGDAVSRRLAIFIDGVRDVTTLETQTANVDASTKNLIIGNNGTDFFDGRIEWMAAYSQSISEDSITTLDDHPGGFIVDFRDTSDFSIGDLLAITIKGTAPAGQAVVTGDLGSNQLLILPIANDIPIDGDIIKLVGNVFNTARQWISETIVESSNPILQIKDRVDNFTKADRATEGTKGFRYTKDALKWKTAICLDFVIEPASQVGSIDDFNPTDLACANTLFISSTTPVSWTGLQAPNPSKPQLIFIINIGTKNITIRNNDASSLAANRFSLNTNVILSPDDCGFLLYDETRLRWRVNKI